MSGLPLMLAGAGAALGGSTGLLDVALGAADCSLVLTTYESLRQLHRQTLSPVRWGVAVLDEGHKIRNPDAEASGCGLPISLCKGLVRIRASVASKSSNCNSSGCIQCMVNATQVTFVNRQQWAVLLVTCSLQAVFNQCCRRRRRRCCCCCCCVFGPGHLGCEAAADGPPTDHEWQSNSKQAE